MYSILKSPSQNIITLFPGPINVNGVKINTRQVTDPIHLKFDGEFAKAFLSMRGNHYKASSCVKNLGFWRGNLGL